MTPVLPTPRNITIFRAPAYSCWMADIPDWNALGVPLPFQENAPALQVMEHLRRLHPQARIIFEEEPQ